MAAAFGCPRLAKLAESPSPGSNTLVFTVGPGGHKAAFGP